MKYLLSTWGSKGDLHPFLSLGQALCRRGHDVTLAGNPDWAEAVAGAGLGFLPAGPRQTTDFLATIPEIASTAGGGRVAIAALMEKWFSPAFADLYRTLCGAAVHHDCLVAHHAVMIAGAVAERTGIPWATVALAPCVIPSRYSLPVSFDRQPWRGPLGRCFNAAVWSMARRGFARIVDPYLRRFRTDHGLTVPRGRDAAFDGGLSRELLLALYSPTFCPPAPDWEKEIRQAGFCFWDPLESYEPPPALAAFLAAGPKPVLVTLGTAMIADPQGLYDAAVDAVRGTGRRAVLLVGRGQNAPADLPDNVFVLDYAPFGWLMPRCAAVIHQCGVGTSAQALRAGLPSVGVPYSFDQPNNARQLEALGVGVVLPPGRRGGHELRAALDTLLADGRATARAAELGRQLATESGPETACDVLERFVVNRRPIISAASRPTSSWRDGSVVQKAETRTSPHAATSGLTHYLRV